MRDDAARIVIIAAQLVDVATHMAGDTARIVAVATQLAEVTAQLEDDAAQLVGNCNFAVNGTPRPGFTGRTMQSARAPINSPPNWDPTNTPESDAYVEGDCPIIVPVREPRDQTPSRFVDQGHDQYHREPSHQ